MDFSVIFQLRSKKFWWMDVIFYFVMSLLIATILCYLIFLVKNGMTRTQIRQTESALTTVGTQSQKDQEKEVITYKNKIADFSNLLKNHGFASNVFAFMQAQTMPNVWFKQFSLDAKNSAVQLSGESDDLDSFSRQVANFESQDNKKYVKNIGTLNSSLGAAARNGFNINLALNKSIFDYVPIVVPVLEAEAATQQPQAPDQAPAPAQDQAGTPADEQNVPVAGGTLSSEKLITSFHLLLIPGVAGSVDETNYIITLNVPFTTDVKNLTSSIVISPNATVIPASGVSQDFTTPVTYHVTAQDGSVKNYQVKVIVASPPQVVKKSNNALLIIIMLVGIIIVILAVVLLIRRKKNAN